MPWIDWETDYTSMNYPWGANFSETGLKLTIFATYLVLTEKRTFDDYISFHYDRNAGVSENGLETMNLAWCLELDQKRSFRCYTSRNNPGLF